MLKLNEGLKEHDLDDLILPLISIDEFESKIDDDALVIAFFLTDQDPANDLNHFIQKGSVEFLDSDVSPAPNEDGYFLVFVEFVRQPKTLKQIMELVDSFKNLTNVDSWNCNIYKMDEVVPFDKEHLLKHVRFKNPDFDGNVKEFFRQSELDDLLIEGNTLTLKRRNSSVQLFIEDFDTFENLVERYGLEQVSVDFNRETIRECRIVETHVGFGWSVNKLGDRVIVVDPNNTHAMMISFKGGK